MSGHFLRVCPVPGCVSLWKAKDDVMICCLDYFSQGLTKEVIRNFLFRGQNWAKYFRIKGRSLQTYLKMKLTGLYGDTDVFINIILRAQKK